MVGNLSVCTWIYLYIFPRCDRALPSVCRVGRELLCGTEEAKIEEACRGFEVLCFASAQLGLTLKACGTWLSLAQPKAYGSVMSAKGVCPVAAYCF